MNLSANAIPQVIKDDEENQRLLDIVEQLLERGEAALSPEQDALLELLTGLIHDYESRAFPLPQTEPHKMVAFLLEQRGQSSNDLELLSGRRSISKEQAKRLAQFFRIRADVFL
jgi:HTH-type transcriptional regulator/antitoxin HigA